VSASTLKSSINRDSPDFQKNTRRIIELLTEIKNQDEQFARAAARKPSRPSTKRAGSLLAKRIAKLIDPARISLNWALSRPSEMYEEWGGAPSAGTITGLARICGRLFMVIAMTPR